MKKIMFYINAINGGGAERVMTNLATQFSEEGYETVLVTSYRAEGEYLLGEKVHRLSLENEEIQQSRIKRNFSRIRKLRYICENEKPDLFVSFMAEPNFRAILATAGLKIKTIVSVRNDPNREYGGKLMKVVGKWLLPFANGCVFQTEEAKSWFPKKLQKKSTIIFNAVKEEFYVKERNPKAYTIVSCGRLQEQKNHKLLIEATADLIDRYPQLKVKIYGEGNLEDGLKQEIKKFKLESVVTLEGQTNNVPEALEEADIFVLTSNYEGMPNALMEAMAMGIPSISTDCPCGGPKMLIEDGIDGLLIPIDDKEKLVNAIKRLFEDQENKQLIGENAKIKVKQFSTDKIFSQWKEYFEMICNI